jgi:NAD(P) transhydrogenase subunit beta
VWVAAASGFLFCNDLLIFTVALVVSSGSYLSYILCMAMKRSFISVIAGGFGIEAPSGDETDYGEHREINAEGAAELLADASSVIITPGYGMAVAQAQYPVADLTRKLREKGVEVRFGIHPVAGRLRRRAEPAVLQGKHRDALRRRQGTCRGHPQSALTWVIPRRSGRPVRGRPARRRC